MAFLFHSSDDGSFNITKGTIIETVTLFVIGPSKTRVAVATFSEMSNVHIHFDFKKYNTKADIFNAIGNIAFYDHDGGVYTGDALQHLQEHLFPTAREDFTHILIVLTDAQAQDNVEDPAKNLQGVGVHIIAVGFNGANFDELEVIASDPDYENVIKARSGSIKKVPDLIRNDVCKGEK